MKQLIITLSFITLSSLSAQAQSLDALLKGLGGLLGGSSEPTEQVAPKKNHPTEQELANKWVFQQLEMEYSGNDPLATLAIASAKQQLSTLATKAGLTAGKDSLKIKSDGTLTVVSGDRKATANYSYIPPTGMIIISLTNGSDTIRVSATATLTNGILSLMFQANELIALAAQSNPKLKEDSLFAVAETLCATYPGITVGLSFK